MTILVIDLSYYTFYRYYATISWYKRAYPDEDIIDYSENVVFLEKFEKMFIETIKKYQKKFKVEKTYLCKDCPRSRIWRNDFYKEYKSNRDTKEFKGGNVFKYSFEELIPKILNNDTFLLHVDKLEGDDIIYLLTKHEKSKSDIIIIASDHDLLQIVSSNSKVSIYEASMKNITNKARKSKDEHNFLKAVLGDPSDNIMKIEKGLGEKTALKLYNDKNLLLKKFREDKELFKKYNLNRLLVDFNYIPNELEDIFKNKYDNII